MILNTKMTREMTIALDNLSEEMDKLNKVLNKEPKDLKEAVFLNNARNILTNGSESDGRNQ